MTLEKIGHLPLPAATGNDPCHHCLVRFNRHPQRGQTLFLESRRQLHQPLLHTMKQGLIKQPRFSQRVAKKPGGRRSADAASAGWSLHCLKQQPNIEGHVTGHHTDRAATDRWHAALGQPLFNLLAHPARSDEHADILRQDRPGLRAARWR